MPDRNDDFYIGYKPHTSRAIHGQRVRSVGLVLALCFVLGAILASSQSDFSDAAFEFGNVREFEGRLTAEPYPVLHIDGKNGSDPHLLVDRGKGGVGQELSALDGRRVRTSGQLIYRAEGRMIELTEQIEAVGSEVFAAGGDHPAGRHTLIGEIVDSKCFLGVMKPGDGKPHRSCAARCISGGAPPALLVKGTDGSSRLLLLSGDNGQSLGPEVLGLVAQPVSVTGTVAKHDGLWYMRTATNEIHRWHGEEE